MFTKESECFEAQLYRGLNEIVEPIARTGFGSPSVLRPGVIIVETTGRKTGRLLTVPLLATQIGHSLLVSTVRRRSQWIKNLASHPEVRYWKDGRRHNAIAVIFTSAVTLPQSHQLPLNLAVCLITALRPYSRIYGGGAALLIPQRSQDDQERGS